MTNSPLVLHVEPLDPVAFEPYGRVIEYGQEGSRLYVPEAFECDKELTSPALWLRRVTQISKLPLQINRLERHPFSAQTFLPAKEFSHLVVVCAAATDNTPDLNTLRAFVAREGQGVSYRRNVWHHGLTILQGTADFIVTMGLTGRNDDDVFLELDRSIEIRVKDYFLAGEQSNVTS